MGAQTATQTEELAFSGRIANWSLGEPPRLELVSDAEGNTVARSLTILKQREFHVTARLIKLAEDVCTLPAALPLIATNIAKCGKGTKVKIDVYPKDSADLLRLLELDDEVFRFIFTDKGERPVVVKSTARAQEQQEKKQKVAKVEEDPQSPEERLAGKAWSLLVYRRTFCNYPGVREMIAKAREPHETKNTTDEQHEILKRVLTVESLSEVGEIEALKFFDNSPPAQAAIKKAFRDAAEKSPDAPTIQAAQQSGASADEDV